MANGPRMFFDTVTKSVFLIELMYRRSKETKTLFLEFCTFYNTKIDSS